ncbi:hypothetical protein C8R46DRAFT_1029350 [Mycena filopes]|nr:hypothetical protein C8R46DRAFT_1029350 [Mycena filopes]
MKAIKPDNHGPRSFPAKALRNRQSLDESRVSARTAEALPSSQFIRRPETQRATKSKEGRRWSREVEEAEEPGETPTKPDNHHGPFLPRQVSAKPTEPRRKQSLGENHRGSSQWPVRKASSRRSVTKRKEGDGWSREVEELGQYNQTHADRIPRLDQPDQPNMHSDNSARWTSSFRF